MPTEAGRGLGIIRKQKFRHIVADLKLIDKSLLVRREIKPRRKDSFRRKNKLSVIGLIGLMENGYEVVLIIRLRKPIDSIDLVA